MFDLLIQQSFFELSSVLEIMCFSNQNRGIANFVPRSKAKLEPSEQENKGIARGSDKKIRQEELLGFNPNHKD